MRYKKLVKIVSGRNNSSRPFVRHKELISYARKIFLGFKITPVKIAQIEKKKKNRIVFKFGIIVERNVLNNILKVPADEV